MEKAVILIVEDGALIRLATTVLLEEAGYCVIEACTADVAIEILATRSDIQVVFTDITMPGSLDGLRLAHAIRNRWPPIQLLITSGLTTFTGAEFPADARFLRKPYTPKQVLTQLHELCSRTPGSYQMLGSIMQNGSMIA